MTEPRLCPSCHRENAPDALFCVGCDVLLPLESATLATNGSEDADEPAEVLRCPSCLTRNTADQVYCWRCLHELHSSDAMDDASPRPLTAALAKATNTADPAPAPEVSPFEPAAEAEAVPEPEAESAPPLAAAMPVDDDPEPAEPSVPLVIPALSQPPQDASLMPTFAAATAIEHSSAASALVRSPRSWRSSRSVRSQLPGWSAPMTMALR